MCVLMGMGPIGGIGGSRKNITAPVSAVVTDWRLRLEKTGRLYTEGRVQEALDTAEGTLRYVRKKSFEEAMVVAEIAGIYFNEGLYSEATEKFLKVMRISGDHKTLNVPQRQVLKAKILLQLGLSYYFINRYKEAIQAFEEYLDMDVDYLHKFIGSNPAPWLKAARLYLANSYVALGDTKQGRNILDDLGRLKEAVGFYQEALSVRQASGVKQRIDEFTAKLDEASRRLSGINEIKTKITGLENRVKTALIAGKKAKKEDKEKENYKQALSALEELSKLDYDKEKLYEPYRQILRSGVLRNESLTELLINNMVVRSNIELLENVLLNLIKLNPDYTEALLKAVLKDDSLAQANSVKVLIEMVGRLHAAYKETVNKILELTAGHGKLTRICLEQAFENKEAV